MKIAINYEDGNIYQHFGQTKTFKMVEVEDGKIVSEKLIDADPRGHANLATQLVMEQVNVVICGSLGSRMLDLLQGADIEVCGNVTGSVDEAVQAYLNGTLKYSTEAHACSCSH